MTTDKGCTSSPSIVVVTGNIDNGEKCLSDLLTKIPNGFTPGCNGANDYFDPAKYLSLSGSATVNFKSQISKALTLGLGVSTGRWGHIESGWQIGGGKRSMNSQAKPILINFAYDLPFYRTGLNLGQTAEINITFFL